MVHFLPLLWRGTSVYDIAFLHTVPFRKEVYSEKKQQKNTQQKKNLLLWAAVDKKGKNSFDSVTLFASVSAHLKMVWFGLNDKCHFIAVIWRFSYDTADSVL